MVLDNQPATNKYSKAFLNLKNVINLEKNEGFNIPDVLLKKFEELEKRFNNFNNGIPLNVIERYFNDHKDNLNKFVYLEYQNNELTDLKVIELFAMLEDYFDEIFTLACSLANFYNLEIKLTKNDSSEKKYI